MAIAALDYLKEEILNKTVGVILCGGNNDIIRMPEIKERALLYAELKHYFLINFPQRSGALKQFVAEILGPNDEITHFRFTKENFRDNVKEVKQEYNNILKIEKQREKAVDDLVSALKKKGLGDPNSVKGWHVSTTKDWMKYMKMFIGSND